METGDKLKKLEEEKGIVIRFVIGHRWVLQLIVDILMVLCPIFLILLLALNYFPVMSHLSPIHNFSVLCLKGGLSLEISVRSFLKAYIRDAISKHLVRIL